MEMKYFFSINSGRCGSDYLSKLLTAVNSSNSKHEASPVGNGKPLRDYNKGRTVEMQELSHSKFDSIMSENETGVYSDTSHLFIQGFGWYAAETLPLEQVGVIVLTRDKEAVVNSFYRIKSTPLTNSGREWLIEVCKKDPINVPPKLFFLNVSLSYYVAIFLKKIISRLNRCHGVELTDPSFLINYEMNTLRWYYDEIHSLGKEFLTKHPEIKSYSIEMKQLNDIDEVAKMFAFFGLAYDGAKLKQLVGVATNSKSYANVEI